MPALGRASFVYYPLNSNRFNKTGGYGGGQGGFATLDVPHRGLRGDGVLLSNTPNGIYWEGLSAPPNI